jgi:hypothetical protein
MRTKIIPAALLLAILTSTAPAHAAYVSAINADLDLHFINGDELTGNINLTLNTPYAAAHLGPWQLVGNLSINGLPVSTCCDFRAGVPGTVAILVMPPSGCCYDFIVNTAFLSPNPTYLDFGLGPLFDASYHYTATSGTVTVLSETLATPLPAALPLFGSGVMMLAGVAWRRRGKVSA